MKTRIRDDRKKNIAIAVVAILAFAGFLVYLSTRPRTPGKYDDFAACLKTQGATFYGAFWCPHCQNQKAMFGDSKDFLPYVECANPDGQSQTQVCIDKHVDSYPTWEFKDGSRLTGEIPLQTLADKTGCKLPQ